MANQVAGQGRLHAGGAAGEEGAGGDVLEDGHLGEGLHDLEGAGAAAPGDAVGGHAGDGLALEADAAGIGAVQPVRTLTNVVLPAPFGPMRPAISPGYRVNDTSASAWRPPNRRPTP